MQSPSVVYVLPDKMGGVATLVNNLLRNRRADGFAHHVLLTKDKNCSDAPTVSPFMADSQSKVEFAFGVENLEKVLRRVRRKIPSGEGVLVANDWIELAVLARGDCARTVFQILHGDYDYYYRMALQHEPIVDGYITHTKSIHDNLRRLLPARRDEIFYLPYGVDVPLRGRVPAPGSIRLIFVGRLVEAKGIRELPEIDRRLLDLGIEATWTIVGMGDDGPPLRSRWSSSRVKWTGALPNSVVLALYRQHDVLVLPSRLEGFPVCLLEAMAAGVVPVVSDIPGGVREVVHPHVTGYRQQFSETVSFAESIADLARNRDKLETMSSSARELVRSNFDVRERSGAYEDLYGRWRELRKPRPKRLDICYGSRLDRAWIPNWLVRAVRNMRADA